MKRRRFLDVTARSLAAAAVPPDAIRSRVSAAAGWVWVHGSAERTPEQWRARFARLRRAGIGGVLVSGGDTATLAGAAHDAGLAFHRWVWIVNRNGDRWAQTHHPEWWQVSRAGRSTLDHPPYVGYYKWVCPTRPAVRAYLREAVDAVARDPGVDGVHLDYIRFPDVILPVGLWGRYGLVQDREYPEFDFCYCAVCRETFRAAGGADPLDLPDPAADPAWRAFRWRVVTELVTDLAATVHARGKAISAAVFPTPTIARRLVRQAWERWPLDLVFPMLYHSFYEQDLRWIGQGVAAGVSALASGRPLYAGLYLPSLSPSALGDAVRYARAAGAAGVSCFEMNGLTDGHLEVLARALR